LTFCHYPCPCGYHGDGEKSCTCSANVVARSDTLAKRADYAEAGIPEYWIVDPENERITVLRLAGDVYAEHGVFKRSETATSALLTGFELPVDAVLDAE
jgi:Uma2 family endonuclease